MNIVRLFSTLILGIILFSGLGCREILDQPSTANVGDIIKLKIKLQYDDEIPTIGNIKLAMQIPQSWQFISLSSDNDFFNNFVEDNYSIEEIIGILGNKEGFKWICGMNNWSFGELKELNSFVTAKLRVGSEAIGLVKIDYAASGKNWSFDGQPSPSPWSFNIFDVPIYIYGQSIELDIPSPCTSKGGETTVLLLDYENKGEAIKADVYFVMQDVFGEFYSYPNWNKDILPFLNNFTIPQGLNIKGMKILDIKYPSEYPLINEEGYYRFYFETTEAGTSSFIGKYGNNLFLVGNEKPTPRLTISGEIKNRVCEDFLIRFDTSNSWDLCDSLDELSVRFDFEGDGVWDTDFQEDKIGYHIFPEPGIYHPIIELKDSGSLISSYQTEFEIEPREGDWTADESAFYYYDYLNLSVISNLVICEYHLEWEYIRYVGPSKPPDVGSYYLEGNFEIEIEDESFSLKKDGLSHPDWLLIDGTFTDCTELIMKFDNLDEDFIASPRTIMLQR